MWWLTLSPLPEVRDRSGLVAGSVSTVSDRPETTAGKEPFFGVTCRPQRFGPLEFPRCGPPIGANDQWRCITWSP
jgi:hypothetical protein